METSFESLWNLDEKDVSPAISKTSCDQSKKKSHKKKREGTKGSIDTNTSDNSGKVIDRKLNVFVVKLTSQLFHISNLKRTFTKIYIAKVTPVLFLFFMN